MKYLRLLLLVPLLLLASCSHRTLAQPVTIYIATDMHYLSPSLDTEEGFFSSPSAANDGKVIHYSAELTQAFLAQVAEEQPDVLILNGDLTLNGASESHRELVALLDQVQSAGIQVLTIAGNHDVNGTAADYSTYDGESFQTMPAVTAEEYRALYAPFGLNQAISRDEHSAGYIYEPAPGLWILMLDTNCYGKGFVQDGTLTWLEDQLKTAKRQGITVLGVSHQNLYAHNELLSYGYQLYNADKLLALYEKYDVTANFSGHIHIQSILNGKVPEISTASLAVTNSTFGQIDCDESGVRYTAREADVAGWAAEQGSTDPNLLNFKEYATWYFEEVGRKQVQEGFADSTLGDQEIALLAETFTKINSAYFSGHPTREEDHTDGLALWRTQAGFHIRYIETMLKAGAREHLTLQIR